MHTKMHAHTYRYTHAYTSAHAHAHTHTHTRTHNGYTLQKILIEQTLRVVQFLLTFYKGL